MSSKLTPERWKQADRFLGEALELEPTERVAFLDEICSGDLNLRREIQALLDAEGSAPDFLDQGVVALAGSALGELDGAPREPAELRDRLGPYKILRQIGAGGMSRVYLGERADGAFTQQVAIKVMRVGSDPRAEYESRFRAERQILASFDHPQIAHVFDGGLTDDGLPYLVMEYVPGLPLTSFCAEMSLSLEDRLELFIFVCGAVQYAHQRLVVHRDLKPSNILVSPEGQVKLLDFGIAKLLDRDTAGHESALPTTRTGMLLLTPEYAAPEQLRGETVTTATDVYALGVLLYELLTGARPHNMVGKTASQIERIVCDEEPKRPSQAATEKDEATPSPVVWPSGQLVGDLDTVVLKVLSKEPHQRYGSARELAEELERFLAGEPVAARPVGPLSRLLRKARRYPRMTAAAVSVAGLLILLGTFTVHTRRSAQREAYAAQRFGQQVELIEATLQRAYLTPLHDVRPELELVQQRMVRIEAEMSRLGGPARAIGDFALGRGYLGLGQDEQARDHLERAWNAGNTDTQVAYALGLTLSRLYRAALEELAQIRSAEKRAIRRREIELNLRNPAMRALEAARDGSSHAEYVAASLDFFAGRPDEALARLASRASREPWFYEADLLAGDIHSESYRVAASSGQAEASRTAFSKAEDSYSRAAEVARSDPRGSEGLCVLFASAAREQYWGPQQGLAGLRDAVGENCSVVLKINPDRAGAHLNLGHVEWLWASYRRSLGEDPRPELQEARRHLRHAAGLDSDDARAWVALGATFRTEASFVSSKGEDPGAAFSRALESYQRAIQIDPTLQDAHSSLSALEAYLGDFERRRGGEPEPHFENAIAAGRRAVELLPGFTGGHVNLGIAYAQLAILRRDQGREASRLFEAGASALRVAIDLNPEFYTAHYNLGELQLERAELLLANREDPTLLIEEATGLLELAERAWPDDATTLFLQAHGETVLARWDQFQGLDPGDALGRAQEWVDRAIVMDSDHASGLAVAARVHLIEAEWQLGRQQSPEQSLDRAGAALEHALEVNPRLAEAHKRRAEVHWLRGRWLVTVSGDPETELRAGLQAAREAVQENPKDAETYLQEARLEALWAQWLAARNRDPGPRIAAGRIAAEKALEIRPGFVEAQGIIDLL